MKTKEAESITVHNQVTQQKVLSNTLYRPNNRAIPSSNYEHRKDHHWVYGFPKEIHFLALNLVISSLIAKNIFYLKLENPSC